MGSLLYMTHPLCVSHYCGVVTAVGLRGRLGGHFLCMAIEAEAVDGCERAQLGLRRGVGARGVGEARAIHLNCLPLCSHIGVTPHVLIEASTVYSYRLPNLGRFHLAVRNKFPQLRATEPGIPLSFRVGNPRRLGYYRRHMLLLFASVCH